MEDVTLPTPPRSSQDPEPTSSLPSSPSRPPKRKTRPMEHAAVHSSIPSSPPRPIKRRAKPTITPRSFRRFFTPRNPTGQSLHAGRRRDALGEVPPGELNVRDAESSSPLCPRRNVFDEDENPQHGSNLAGLKYITPGSSPNYRARVDASSVSMKNKRRAALPGHLGYLLQTNVERSAYRGALGAVSMREIGSVPEAHLRLTGRLEAYRMWQPHVASFCSTAEDVYTCRDPFQDEDLYTMPFSVASCRSSSLVAIGDEQGCIRLLDTEKSGSGAHMARPYLAFRPHDNAVLDMSFSADDYLLATASGDQDSSIIDMRTQKVIYSLRGHSFSVKQVRFQPGSDHNVIATSSRDGAVRIWDLRCKAATQRPTLHISLDGPEQPNPSHQPPPKLAACVASIHQAHQVPMPATLGDRGQSQSRQQSSVTAISFLDETRPHLLLSGSEANAAVKLWDLRTKSGGRRWQPIGATRQPEAHGQHRKFGLTSMALSGDCSRLFTLCKDHTVYAYSLNHLMLGTVPEMENRSAYKRRSETKEGLGPLYSLQHPKLRVPTFYIKAALRPSRFGNAELLALGSTEACAVLFPTNENFHATNRANQGASLPRIRIPSIPNVKLPDMGGSRVENHQNGTALIRGHSREVTGLTWTPNGELVTIGDDYQCRIWREDAEHARELRICGESGGNRWRQGWADFQAEDPSWDDDE